MIVSGWNSSVGADPAFDMRYSEDGTKIRPNERSTIDIRNPRMVENFLLPEAGWKVFLR